VSRTNTDLMDLVTDFCRRENETALKVTF
jgi:hypothetical protein